MAYIHFIRIAILICYHMLRLGFHAVEGKCLSYLSVHDETLNKLLTVSSLHAFRYTERTPYIIATWTKRLGSKDSGGTKILVTMLQHSSGTKARDELRLAYLLSRSAIVWRCTAISICVHDRACVTRGGQYVFTGTET